MRAVISNCSPYIPAMIRNAEIGDVPRIVELGRLMHAESNFSGMSFNEHKTAAFLRDLIAMPNGFVQVTESDGVVVGVFAGAFFPHFFSDDLMATDMALFLHSDHRGGKDAARLLRAYAEWAMAHGVKRIVAGVTTGLCPVRAAKLYALAGFAPIGGVFEFKE